MKVRHTPPPGPITFFDFADVQPTPPAKERPNPMRRPTPRHVRSHESARVEVPARESKGSVSWHRKVTLWLKGKWGLLHKPSKA